MLKVIDKNTGEYVSNMFGKEDETLVKVEYEPFNVVFNLGIDGLEVIYYDKPFLVPKHLAHDSDYADSYITDPDTGGCITGAKWVKGADGVLVPARPDVRVSDLVKSMLRSGKQAKKKFYDYALANTWQYFCTWTFADETIRNDKDLIYLAWNKFIKQQRKDNPDLKAIGVYEAFTKGGYHMHALFKDCVFNLQPAISPHTNTFMYSAFRNQIFNALDWQHGWSTVVCIDPKSANEQVVNYLSKYLTKESAAPYRCKRYFHTQNCDCRKTYIMNITGANDDIMSLMRKYAGTDTDLIKLKGNVIFEKIKTDFALIKRKSKNGIHYFRSNVDVSELLEDYDNSEFIRVRK